MKNICYFINGSDYDGFRLCLGVREDNQFSVQAKVNSALLAKTIADSLNKTFGYTKTEENNFKID